MQCLLSSLLVQATARVAIAINKWYSLAPRVLLLSSSMALAFFLFMIQGFVTRFSLYCETSERMNERAMQRNVFESNSLTPKQASRAEPAKSVAFCLLQLSKIKRDEPSSQSWSLFCIYDCVLLCSVLLEKLNSSFVVQVAFGEAKTQVTTLRSR